MDANVWALVAAAGSGERLAADRPKAFVRLGDRPLLAESLERLDDSDWIDTIVVAAPPDWEEPVILLADELGCGKVSSSVTGADTRAESVRAALAEVPEDAAVVLVHDAARPLVTDDVIGRVVSALGEGFDGAIPVLPVADTIKVARGDEVVETLERSELVAAQTPQAFVAPVLREALAGDIAAASDCASLVERRGGRVKVVEGDRRLLKVTEPADLELVATWALEGRRGPTGEPGVRP
jgi:2-C-methyl-D-erythritol 4-phosphate cytidylyltransferase